MVDIQALIKEMTLEEKASLCSGLDFWLTKPIERLGIPSARVSDGPHGLRKEDDTDPSVGVKQSFPATAFPPAVNIASSWDENVAKEVDLIVTCEEHNVIGGFGSAVAEVLAEMKNKRATLLRVGLNDEYSIRVGNQKYLRTQYGIDAASIVEKIIKWF